jgi:predicted nuclease of restriction endonuclease-like (RecB) superfamily
MIDAALATLIERVKLLQAQAQRAAVAQTSYQLTRRNWLIGRHLAEGEQPSADYAVANSHLVAELAHFLPAAAGLSAPQLAQCRYFYRTYPELFPTGVGAAATWGLPAMPPGPADSAADIPAEQLRRLSFAHFCELLPLPNARQRTFYEGQAIRSNWPVRVLKQAIDSLLYERAVLARDQEALLAEYAAAAPAPPAGLATADLRHFLGLTASSRVSDSATTTLPRLKAFLLGLDRGFCFEAQSQRLALAEEHVLVDLVFYHRVLKCHFLVNVRFVSLRPADSRYLNGGLRHYRENEKAPDDNPPVGLLLGVRPVATQVSYLTPGSSAQIFAHQHRALLPSEAELSAFFEEEEPS